jgi:predicted heme/steroid binding protein
MLHIPRTISRAACGAVLTALAVALVVVAGAGAAVTPANGQDYILPNGNVYQLVNGTYRLIPDLQTANAMHIDWNRLHRVGAVQPTGAPLPSVLPKPVPPPVKIVAPVMMANGKDYVLPNGNVYQLVNGSYRLIRDTTTANKMGIKWDKLYRVAHLSPIGKPLPSVVQPYYPLTTTTCNKKTAARANGQDYLLQNGNVYQFSGGSFHLIPDVPTANAMGLQWNKLTLVRGLSPITTPISSICTTTMAA